MKIVRLWIFLLALLLPIASAAQGWTKRSDGTGAACNSIPQDGLTCHYVFTDTTDPPILTIGKDVSVISLRLNPDTTGGGATGCEVQAYRCDAGGTFSTTTCPSKILWDVSQPADTVLDDVTIDGTSSPDLRAGADFVAVRYLGFDVTANGSGDSCRITVEGH